MEQNAVILSIITPTLERFGLSEFEQITENVVRFSNEIVSILIDFQKGENTRFKISYNKLTCYTDWVGVLEFLYLLKSYNGLVVKDLLAKTS